VEYQSAHNKLQSYHNHYNYIYKFNYSHADWDNLNQALSEINCNTGLGEEYTNEVHNFLTKVEQACRNYLPIKNVKPISRFIPMGRRILMRKRT